MIELGKVYLKKENHNVRVIPTDINKGIVDYNEIHYPNLRQRPVEDFLKVFELESDVLKKDSASSEKEYDVTVTRTSTQFTTVRVKAGNVDEAAKMALDKAGDIDFSNTEKSADYSVDGVMRVKQ